MFAIAYKMELIRIEMGYAIHRFVFTSDHVMKYHSHSTYSPSVRNKMDNNSCEILLVP